MPCVVTRVERVLIRLEDADVACATIDDPLH